MLCRNLYDDHAFIEGLAMFDGRRRFRFDMQGGTGAARTIVVGSNVIVCDDEHVHALDLETGKLRWKTRVSNAEAILDVVWTPSRNG